MITSTWKEKKNLKW